MSRFTLIEDELGYGLKDQLTDQRALRIDFTSAQLTHRRLHGGKKELLFKAVKAKPGCKVWDCTAGLGVDSFLLAAQGCEVTLFERSTILALLLEQALAAAMIDESIGQIALRMQLKKMDAIKVLGADLKLMSPAEMPDVILIDPMFPTRRKSARVKGKMQILQQFLGKDEDALGLLDCAINSGVPRVVVKRPANGGELENFKPDYSLVAKANRFDVFLNPARD